MEIKEEFRKSKEEVEERIGKIPVEMIKKDPSLVGDSFYSGGLQPVLEAYIPEGLNLTHEEMISLKNGIKNVTTGLRCAIPLTCYGKEKCPFSKACPFAKIGKTPTGKICQPPGETVRTAHHGQILIEDLDPEEHTLVSYNRRRNFFAGGHEDERGIKKGSGFKKVSRDYEGDILHLKTEKGKTQKVTTDHISIARFNENALNKFCVYLMRKGDFLRVGKSKILGETNGKTGRKFYLPVAGRLSAEKADALWILGTYETNTEALLAEEYYSCNLQAPKTLFLEDRDREKVKWNGMYRWVTQEQLDAHHKKFVKPSCYWGHKLAELGLSWEHPFFEKDNSERTYKEVKVFSRRTMKMHSCNLTEGIMDVPVYPENGETQKREGKQKGKKTEWERLQSIEREHYKGKVYSLDVENHHAYFSGDIATHNCPVEALNMDFLTKRYIDEFNVLSSSMSEIITMQMLAATHIMEERAWKTLANSDDERPDGLIKNVVGFNNDDEPIIQLQEHPAHNQIERAWRWRRNLLESLVGTRKEKYKRDATLKQKEGVDSPASFLADMKSKIEKKSHLNLRGE